MSNAVRVLAGVVLAAGLACASASADSLVYVKDSNVWVSAPNGSGPRQLTSDGTSQDAYSWPSESDAGEVVAVGPGPTAPDGTFGANLYVMDQQGQVARQILTPADTGVVTCIEFPPVHARVSPDGTKVAYVSDPCGNGDTTYWTSATDTSGTFPGQSLGQQQFVSPAWIDDSHLLLSYLTTPTSGQGTAFTTYTVGNGDDDEQNWFDDANEGGIGHSGWATSFDAVISRQGDRLAIVEDDVAGNGGQEAAHVAIRLYTANGPAPAAPTFRCELDLPLSQWSGIPYEDDAGLASPSFSPDGTQLAFAENDGTHVLTLGDLTSSCPTLADAPLVIADAYEPFWSPAALQAATGGSGGSGGSGGGGSGGSGGGSSGGTGGGGRGGSGATAPVLRALRVSPGTIHAHGHHHPATISWSDTTAATTTLTIQRDSTGVRHGDRCSPAHGRRRAHGRRCTLYVTVARLHHHDRVGANRISFNGRVHGHALAPGGYRLVAMASSGGRSSHPLSTRFSIRR